MEGAGPLSARVLNVLSPSYPNNIKCGRDGWQYLYWQEEACSRRGRAIEHRVKTGCSRGESVDFRGNSRCFGHESRLLESLPGLLSRNFAPSATHPLITYRRTIACTALSYLVAQSAIFSACDTVIVVVARGIHRYSIGFALGVHLACDWCRRRAAIDFRRTTTAPSVAFPGSDRYRLSLLGNRRPAPETARQRGQP